MLTNEGITELQSNGAVQKTHETEISQEGTKTNENGIE